MPRIDPTRLLCCLKPLLNLETGGIKSERDVDKIFGLMSKFSKKLVSKCTYINILLSTPEQILNVFMERGGWSMIHEWTVEAKNAKNHQLLNEILKLLLHTPATINRLKENTLPKEVKQISSKWDIEDTKSLAEKIVHKWIAIAKNEQQLQQQQQQQASASSSASLPLQQVTTNPTIISLNHPQQHPTPQNITNHSFVIMQTNNNSNNNMGPLNQMPETINATTVNSNSSDNLVVGNQTMGLSFERADTSAMEIDASYDYINDLQDSELSMMDVCLDNFNPDLFSKTMDQLDSYTESDNIFQLHTSNSANSNNMLVNDIGLPQPQPQTVHNHVQPQDQTETSQPVFLSPTPVQEPVSCSSTSPVVPAIVIKNLGGQHSIVNAGSENHGVQDSQSAERICYVVHNGQKFLLKLPQLPATNNNEASGMGRTTLNPNNQQQVQLIVTQDQQVTSSSVPTVEIVQEQSLSSPTGTTTITGMGEANTPQQSAISPTKRRRPRKDPTITNNKRKISPTNLNNLKVNEGGKGLIKTYSKKVEGENTTATATTTATASLQKGEKVPEKNKLKLDSKDKLNKLSSKDLSGKSTSKSKTSSSTSSSKSSSSSGKRSSSQSKAALEEEKAKEEKLRQQTKEARKKAREREKQKELEKKAEELEKQKQKDSKTLEGVYGSLSKPGLAVLKIPKKKSSFADMIGVPGAKEEEPVKKITKEVKHSSDASKSVKSSSSSSSSTSNKDSSLSDDGTPVDVGFGVHARAETSNATTNKSTSSASNPRRVKVFVSSKSKNMDILDTMLQTSTTKSKTESESTSNTNATASTSKLSASLSFEDALTGASSSNSNSSSSSSKSKRLSPDGGKESKRLRLDGESHTRTSIDKKEGKTSSSERRKSSESSKKSDDKASSTSSSSSSKEKSSAKTQLLQESSFFMDSITAKSSKSTKKPGRSRRLSSSTDEGKNVSKEQVAPSSSSTAAAASPSKEKPKDNEVGPPVFNFYRDTLNDDDEDDDKDGANKNEAIKEESTIKDTEKDTNKDDTAATGGAVVTSDAPTTDKAVVIEEGVKESTSQQQQQNAPSSGPGEVQEIQDDFAPVEGEGKLKSCLCIHRPKGKPKKLVKWREEDELKEYHYFEMDETERVNVSRPKVNFTEMKQMERSQEKKSIQRKNPLPGDSMEEKISTWPAKLRKIRLDPNAPLPVVDSREQYIQEERERGILEVFYFPGALLPDHPSEADVFDADMERSGPPKTIPSDDVPNQTQSYDLRTTPWPTPKYVITHRERIAGVGNPTSNHQANINPLSLPPSSSSSALSSSSTRNIPTFPTQLLNNLANPLANLGVPGFPPFPTSNNPSIPVLPGSIDNASANNNSGFADMQNPWNQALAATTVVPPDPWTAAAAAASVPVHGFIPGPSAIPPPFFSYPPPQMPQSFPVGQFVDPSTSSLPSGNANNGSSGNRNVFNNNPSNTNHQSSRSRDVDYRDLGNRRNDDRGDRNDRRDRNRDRDSRSDRGRGDRDYRERDRHSGHSSSYEKDRDYRHSDRNSSSYSRGQRAPNGRRLCSYFSKGFCREGNKCTFYHPSPGNGPSSHSSITSSSSSSSHDTTSEKRISPPPRTSDKNNTSSSHLAQSSPSSSTTTSSSGSSRSNNNNSSSSHLDEIPPIASPTIASPTPDETDRFTLPPSSPTNDTYPPGTEAPKVIPTFVDDADSWE